MVKGRTRPKPSNRHLYIKKKEGLPDAPSRKGGHHSHKPGRLPCRSPQDFPASPSVGEQWYLLQRWGRIYTSKHRPLPTHSQQRQGGRWRPNAMATSHAGRCPNIPIACPYSLRSRRRENHHDRDRLPDQGSNERPHPPWRWEVPLPIWCEALNLSEE